MQSKAIEFKACKRAKSVALTRSLEDNKHPNAEGCRRVSRVLIREIRRQRA